MSQKELPGLPQRAWGGGVAENGPQARGAHRGRPWSSLKSPKRFLAGSLTLWDINHASPSLDHPQDASYTAEFVKGKKRGRENPWACLQVHGSAKERYLGVMDMEACKSFGENLVCKC